MDYKLSQVRLLVTDFPACFRFYRDVLGFKPAYGTEDETYAMFETGSVQLELFKRELMADAIGIANKPRAADAQDVVLLSMQVDNVDAAVDELKAKGVTISYAPTDRTDWGVRAAHFRDPSNTLLELWQRLATA